MIQAARVDLTVDRWVPFAPTIDITGIDLTGATLRAQVRLFADAPGDPLIDMPTVTTATVNGMRFLSADTTGLVPISHLQMQILAASIAAMPEAAEIGNDVSFAWDLVITPNGGQPTRWFYGNFTVRAGVTR